MVSVPETKLFHCMQTYETKCRHCMTIHKGKILNDSYAASKTASAYSLEAGHNVWSETCQFPVERPNSPATSTTTM